MKRDELTPIELECNMGKDSVTGLVNREPWKAYDIDEVDAVIAELKSENKMLKKHIANGDVSRITWIDEATELKAENEILKAKLENVQASAYADSVDAGMRELRLQRALWLARAERAKEHLWHDVNSDGSPKEDYKGHDWVLVQLRETDCFELIPRVAEYRRHLKRWVFIDEDYDTENTHSFRFLREQCKVIGWHFIDFAYYGKKFFVQQEINKNVERKCRAMAEKFK